VRNFEDTRAHSVTRLEMSIGSFSLRLPSRVDR